MSLLKSQQSAAGTSSSARHYLFSKNHGRTTWKYLNLLSSACWKAIIWPINSRLIFDDTKRMICINRIITWVMCGGFYSALSSNSVLNTKTQEDNTFPKRYDNQRQAQRKHETLRNTMIRTLFFLLYDFLTSFCIISSGTNISSICFKREPYQSFQHVKNHFLHSCHTQILFLLA